MGTTAGDQLEQLYAIMIAASNRLLGDGVDSPSIQLARPPEAQFGDYSTNAALLLAPLLKSQPRDIAEQLKSLLEDSLAQKLTQVEIAGPGFVNLFMSDSWYRTALQSIALAGDSYGANVAIEPERINLEFVSANPTGPMHIGHGRHAAFGDTLARTLELAGHEVTREFYINDFGGQIRRFGQSIAARRKGEEVPEDGYRGVYVKELANELSNIDADDADALARGGIEIMIDHIRATLDRFRVRFDKWSSEAELHEGGKVEAALEELCARGQVYEKEGATWLRTTTYGDDKDRVLKRSDGEPTYFAADIAYHQQKRASGYDRLIDLLGADHHGYVERMQAAFVAIGGDPGQLELLIMQLVQIIEEGERSQMSKRKGEFVSLDELIDDIGTDAARFFLLNRSHESPIDLDLDLARRQSQENPVYYCQYSHARIASILRKAGDKRVTASTGTFASSEGGDSPALDASEKLLIKRLLEFPEHVTQAAARRAPHRFTAYVMDVASDFNAFYRDCQVLGAESQQAEAFRLKLCLVTQSVLARTLGLLGIDAPDQM